MNLLRQQRIITTAVLRNVTPAVGRIFTSSMVAVFLRMLVTAGNHLPNFTAYCRTSHSLNTYRPELKFHKTTGHTKTNATTGDEIKEYDLGDMW